MANPLSEMFQAQLLAHADPNAAVMKDFSKTFVAQQGQELIRLKSETIETIEQKLNSAIGRNASASVINAYEKLLASTVS